MEMKASEGRGRARVRALLPWRFVEERLAVGTDPEMLEIEGGVGWGTWIRTRTNGVRVRWSTVNLFPNVAGRLVGDRAAHASAL